MYSFIKNLKSTLKKNWKSFLACFLITLGSAYMLYEHFSSVNAGEGFVYMVESKILDAKIRQRGEDRSPTKVGILAIDERSIDKFGRFPFSRKYYKQAFENLKELGVEWIGFDVIFSEAEKARLEDVKQDIAEINFQNFKSKKQIFTDLVETSSGDRLLAEGIANFENIVMGYFYFGNMYEAKANTKGRDPFRWVDSLESSAIEYLMLPDQKTIPDYVLLSKAYGLTTNLPAIAKSSEHHAFFSNDADDDAINRWVTLVAEIDGKLYPSLALKTAAEYLDREIIVFFNDVQIDSIGLINRENEDDVLELPIDRLGRGRLLVNHRGGHQGFRHFSLADAYDNKFTDEEKSLLKGSVLLLGATATGINDLRPNPFEAALDGVENHAAAIDNIIKKNYLRRPVEIIETEFKIIIGVGLLFTPILIFGKAVFSFVALLLFLGGYYYVDQVFWFGQGIWTFMALPCGEILSMFLVVTTLKYMGEEKDKAYLKSAFGSYISPELIDEMFESGEPPKLGGDSGIRTAYFTDIQSFSSFSEQLSATALVELLNEYLTAMTDILLEDKGTLDKYEGDAIIAFFGAPMTLEDHATRACRVAANMQKKLLELRQKWVSEGDKWPVIVKEMRMRIGINSGEIVTGNMGSRDRMNYTMMGDSVNLAARLEEAAKQYGIFTQVSHFTKNMCEDEFIWRELDTIRVVGKTEPVTTFELVCLKGDEDENLTELVATFHEALAHYKESRWDEAIAGFKKSLEFEYIRFPLLRGKKTNPSEVYIKRCEEYKENPPPQDWGGVYTLTSK